MSYNFTKLFGMIKNGSIIDYLQYKIRRQRILSFENPIEYQEKLLVQILQYACQHCDYYKRLDISIFSAEDIVKFPFLTKQIVRNEFDNLISDEKNRLLYFEARTGGSTGEPLKFLNVPGVDDIFQKKVWEYYKYEDGDIILALDGATIDESIINSGKYLYKKSESQIPYGGYGLSSMYLTDENIHIYVRELLNLQPSFIRGYPSFVYRIAQYMKENDIQISFSMKGIELTSETCMDYQRDLISSVFKCQVFMQYGHTECCAFGFTFDDSMRYRIEPLYGFLEVIKENGEPAEKGEVGEIVVTSLFNKAFPLIRYKTGDYAEFGSKDEKGIILNKILGRTQDFIVDSNGEKVLLTALIHAQHNFRALGHIERWQIEQNTPGKVIIHIIKGRDYNDSDSAEIIDVFWHYGRTKVVFDFCEIIPLTLRGKSKLIIQNIIE